MAKPIVRYVSVPRLWPGETAVLIGGGPSLTPEDVTYVRGKARVIAINDAYRLAPWADVLYACDATWWRWHQGAPSFTGLKYTLDRGSAGFAGVQSLRNTGRDGLELKPTGLRIGKNSGYQAINLAVHLGATRLVLLGYDMQPHGDRDHWFGAHPQTTRSPYIQFISCFNRLAPILQAHGITVVNCSPRTALTCFPRAALRDALPDAMAVAS